MTLVKDSIYTYVPGNPGSPGYPGQPAHPAYYSVETVCTGTHHFLVPVYEHPITGERSTGSNPGGWDLIGYVVETFPGGCHEVTTYHPAQPAIPSIPAVPASLSSFLINHRIGWNAGAYSIGALDGDVQTTFRIAACPGGIFIGFANNPSGIIPSALDYAFYFRHPTVDVWERGAWKWGVTNFTLADDFRLKRVAGVVSYWKNGALLYTSATPSVGTLHVDCSMYCGGDTVN